MRILPAKLYAKTLTASTDFEITLLKSNVLALCNFKLVAANSSVNMTIKIYDQQNNLLSSFTVTTSIELNAKDIDWARITINDSTAYTVYYTLQTTLYDSEKEMLLAERYADISLVPINQASIISPVDGSGYVNVDVQTGSVGISSLAATSAFITSLNWRSPSRTISAEPSWVDGIEVTAPAAGTALVSKTVTTAKTGAVFGVSISASEGNQFHLLSGLTVIKQFSLAAAGVVFIVSGTPLLDAVSAATVITIKNVTIGSASQIYQASLLYEEQ